MNEQEQLSYQVPENNPKAEKGCFIGVLMINIPLLMCSFIMLMDLVKNLIANNMRIVMHYTADVMTCWPVIIIAFFGLIPIIFDFRVIFLRKNTSKTILAILYGLYCLVLVCGLLYSFSLRMGALARWSN